MSAVLEAREPSARYLEAVQPALVRQFELLATAPGGVARLREFILSLAVQGKLTAQDCDEEPASALLERIQDRKLRSIASGAIKQGKKPAELNDAEPMFELPKGWTWTRLGELCSYVQRGKGPAYAEQSEHKVISQKCVRWYGLDLAPARFVTAESLAKYEPVRFLRAGDLLWNSTGTGTIGRACVVPIELDDAGLVADSHVTVVRPLEVNSVFLWRWIQSPFVQNEIEGSASGTTNQIELNTSTVLNQPVPLPPLAEQARIVDRVDELMRLCDSLEAKGLLEAEQHARLLGTLLGTLTDSSTPEELATNWQRVADHFDLLLDRPEAVDALEQTILQLAVRGLLVPQDPSSEPADLWVRRMNSNRVHRRTAAATPTLADTDRPDLPAGWCVTNVGSVAECLDYIRRPVKKSDREASEGSVPYYGANGQTGWINEHLFDEDLVLVVEDETFIGRTKPFSYVVQGKSWVNNHAHVLRPLGGLSADFLNLCLERYDFIPLTSGTTNRRKLTQPGLLNAEFMIGPLEEQVRILARVTELRRLCANLRQRLAASQTTQSRLAEAMVDVVT